MSIEKIKEKEEEGGARSEPCGFPGGKEEASLLNKKEVQRLWCRSMSAIFRR
jgi:hypothetical protein